MRINNKLTILIYCLLGGVIKELLATPGRASAAENVSLRGSVTQDPAPIAQGLNLVYLIHDDLFDVTNLATSHPLHGKLPGIQKLINRGIVIDQDTEHPVCGPSRGTKLTGRRSRINDFDHYVFQLGMNTVMGELVSRGYYVGTTGKVIHQTSNDAMRAKQLLLNMNQTSERATAIATGNSACGKEAACKKPNKQLDDYPVNMAFIDFLKRMANRKEQTQPWAYFKGSHRPHLVISTSKKNWQKIKGDLPTQTHPLINITAGKTNLAHRRCDDVENLKIYGQSLVDGKNRKNSDDIIKNRKLVKKFRGAYYSSVKDKDDDLKQVLDAIDNSPYAANTIVIFTSDHGFSMADDANLWCKGHLYDSATRTPLIISVPGIEGGKHSKTLASSIDEVPTILELLFGKGTTIRDKSGITVEGQSLVPALLNPDLVINKKTYSKYPICQTITQAQTNACTSSKNSPGGIRPKILYMCYKVKYRPDESNEWSFMGCWPYQQVLIGLGKPTWSNQPQALAGYGDVSMQVDLRASHTIFDDPPIQPQLYVYPIGSNQKYVNNLAYGEINSTIQEIIDGFSTDIKTTYEKLGM